MENILTGFKRHFIERLRSLSGTPSSIAGGAAVGVMVSFTPFVGLHTLLAVVLAWALRFNVLAAAIGTIAGNPWTFPFIWAAVYYTGRIMLEGSSVMLPHVKFDFSRFFSDIWPVLKPMIVGCVPFCIAAWIISYYIVKNTLDKLTRS